MATLLHKPHREIDGLSLHFAADIAIIVMDNGQNRFNPTFFKAFHTLLDEVESNESCKGLITTGKGKFYSNGLDLNLMATLPQNESANNYLGLLVLVKRVMFLPIPTLAAINGHAFAGGAILAMAHDLRTMNTEKGWISVNEVFLNFRLGMFNLLVLESKLGGGKNYSDALVLGKRFTAKEAFDSGLTHAIQPLSLLLNDSIRVLKSFYGKGYLRESLSNMKGDVYRSVLNYYESSNIERLYAEKRGDISMMAKL